MPVFGRFLLTIKNLRGLGEELEGGGKRVRKNGHGSFHSIGVGKSGAKLLTIVETFTSADCGRRI